MLLLSSCSTGPSIPPSPAEEEKAKPHCHACELALTELENIDDDREKFGIQVVRISDLQVANKYGIKQFAALIYFRNGNPLIYDGDLEDEETLLKWLTSNDVFEIKDEIEEENREMVEKLIEDNELVAVLFYGGNDKSKSVLAELEHIDDEADALDIMFLKIMDPVYAKKFGITRLPALVYFRKRIPLIYQGNLLNEEEVLVWLGKDSHRHSEVNIFVYGLIGAGACFALYVACQYCQKKSKTD